MQIGYNSVCINPMHPCDPVGFAKQSKCINKIRGDLYARCLIMCQEPHLVVLITIDNLGLNRACYDRIQTRIQTLFDRPIHVIITCSHTHYAPSLSDYMGLFNINSEYEQIVLTKLANLVKNCHYFKRELTYSYQCIPFTGVGSCRNHVGTKSNVYASVFSFYEDNTRIGSILSYNCHPTISDPMADYFSSDYPGVVCESLQSRYPKEFFLFLQGADGDISTRYTRKEKSYGEVIRLANLLSTCFEGILQAKNVQSPLSFDFAYQDLPIQPKLKDLKTIKLDPTISGAGLQEILLAQAMNSTIQQNFNNQIQVASFSRLTLGKIRLVFNPFELFSAYLDAIDLGSTMIVGHSYASMGYLGPINNQELSYESILDFVINEDKQKILQLLKTL